MFIGKNIVVDRNYCPVFTILLTRIFSWHGFEQKVISFFFLFFAL